MTPNQAGELIRALSGKPTALHELHERARASGSAWTAEQLQLFLLCAAGVRHNAADDSYRASEHHPEQALQDAIVEAVRSFAGRPIPALQVRARLPNHFVTTDEQILAVARRTPELDVFGPNLLRLTP